MSEDYYIGLSREQIEKLLNGEEVGKRPYYVPSRDGDNHNGDYKYNGTIRIHVKMLSNTEEIKEPESAFSW